MWSTPKTWLVGDTLSAALLNANLRDELLALRQANQAYALAWVSPSQSIPHNTWTTVGLNGTAKLAGSVFDGPTHRLLAPIAGYYGLTAHLHWDANATGVRELRAVSDAGTIYSLDAIRAVAGGSYQTVNRGAGLWHLNAGQYLTVAALQTSGVARLLAGGTDYQLTRASWRLLGE